MTRKSRPAATGDQVKITLPLSANEVMERLEVNRDKLIDYVFSRGLRCSVTDMMGKRRIVRPLDMHFYWDRLSFECTGSAENGQTPLFLRQSGLMN